MQDFKTMKIGQIEKAVDKLDRKSRESEKQKYETLEYLRTSKRFRENNRYKKASFWEYIEDRFTIRERTFRENTDAFMKYPAESVEFGVGLVAKVKRQCGRGKVKTVFSKIQEEQSAKKGTLRRDQIDKIISGESVRIEKKYTDWRAMYEAEKVAHERTRDLLRESLEQVDQKNEQIKKLKEAIYSLEAA